MPFGLGPRFVVEAAFIVAVAVAAGIAGFSTWAIVLVMAIAWIVASGIEWTSSRRRSTQQEVALTEPAEPLFARELELEPEALPPPLVAVSAPLPEPEPQQRGVAQPPRDPAVVPLLSRDARAREWNVWELERLVRGRVGEDPGREEELNFLLMYLREFANADGVLPVDFDSLVRDSFADVLAAPVR